MRASSFLLCVALATAPAALAGNRSPDVVDDAEAFALTDRARAATLLEQALPEASNRDIGAVLLHAGEHRRLLGQHDAARAHFDAVLDSSSRSADPAAARAGLLLIDAATSVTPDTVGALRRLSDSDILPSQNADRYMVLALVAAAEGDASAFERSRARAVSFAADHPAHSEHIVARLDGVDVAAETVPLEQALSLEAEAGTTAERAEEAIATGNPERARRLISQMRADADSELERRTADYLQRKLEGVRVNPERIGVLLPLSGRYGAVGTQVRQAFEYGYANGGGTGELIIVDSGTTEESAIAAAETLVFDDGVVSLVGPLLSGQAAGLADASEAMRVPLIGLSQSLEPTEEQQFVTRATVSVGDQVRALVDYTTGQANMRRFGVFAPDNDYGRSAATVFKESVAAAGGTIADEVYYDPSSNDMTAAARRLRRVEYDGLFIPDNASRVPLACAGLAYEEFPVGSFQPEPGQQTIRLLGLNSWNNPDILTQGGNYVRNALFTELFVADSSEAQSFEQSYSAANGRTPSALEAVVSDVGRLVAAAHQQRPESAVAFRDAVLSAAPTGTATGLQAIGEGNKTASHRLRILTITRDSIEVVE